MPKKGAIQMDNEKVLIYNKIDRNQWNKSWKGFQKLADIRKQEPSHQVSIA